jgi:Rrf2 family iron-sulfur cluster assembly transcriptional regulator
MRLSTKGRYAVTSITDLALHACAGPVTLADISERQGLSLSYLEQMFAQLRRQGLVTGVRGPGGGYTLARATTDISVADVIAAVEQASPTASSSSLDATGDQCLTHDLWDELSVQIQQFLAGITLAELTEA